MTDDRDTGRSSNCTPNSSDATPPKEDRKSRSGRDSREGRESRENLDSSGEDSLCEYEAYSYRDRNGMKRWTHCPKCHESVMVVALIEPTAAQVAPCGCRLPPEVLKR